jgi:preprotein translocase subunit YajC
MSIYSKNLIYLVLCLSYILILVSCAEDGSGPNNNVHFGENTFTYDVEYSDDTYIVTKEKKNSLIKVDTVKVSEKDPITGESIEVKHYSFTFDDMSIAENLHNGSKIIIHGDYMAKVKSVTTNGSQVILETEPTTLKEVIKNGTIEWDITPEVAQIEMIEINGKKDKSQ